MKQLLICRIVAPGVCLAAILMAAASWGAEDKEVEKPPKAFDPVRQFDHLGIFTAQKHPNERLVNATALRAKDTEE
jgi:hypothetical protein